MYIAVFIYVNVCRQKGNFLHGVYSNVGIVILYVNMLVSLLPDGDCGFS